MQLSELFTEERQRRLRLAWRRARSVPGIIARTILNRARTPLDLEWFLGWRETFWIGGFASVIWGVHLYSVPLAWIIGGLGFIGLGWFMADTGKGAAE